MENFGDDQSCLPVDAEVWGLAKKIVKEEYKVAKVKLNPVLELINGKVGDLVFKRYQDKVVIARKVDPSDQEPTPAQQAVRERFRAGALYGKQAAADPAVKALYVARAKAKAQPFFSLMVADYLHAPTVTAVDLEGYTGAAGETIWVTAFDDFEVTAVKVSLADADGVVLEAGAAVLENGRWTYTTTTTAAPGTAVTVTATALDRPGNSGRGEATQVAA